jgi:nicotinate-nucleotide adenylyltransferase
MKIGLFGGTFDPVHYGHLRPIEEAATALGLDRVVYVPNDRSPFKNAVAPADPRHRVAMLALALVGRPAFSISLAELDRPSPSYSVDTLREFSREHPGDELFFLLGTDALAGFSRWRQPSEIIRLARLATFIREPYQSEDVLAREDLAPFRKSILILDTVRVKISSSDLRHTLLRGEKVSGSMPPAVEEYIVKHSLYIAMPEATPA